MKLLVIDDNHDVSSMIAQYLRLKGYDCVVTDDGKEGLGRILNEKYDVILLDLAMPEFSGYDVIASLEREGKLREQKLIIITVYPLTEEKVKDLENRGVYACLKKPVQLPELVRVIQSSAKV